MSDRGGRGILFFVVVGGGRGIWSLMRGIWWFVMFNDEALTAGWRESFLGESLVVFLWRRNSQGNDTGGAQFLKGKSQRIFPNVCLLK